MSEEVVNSGAPPGVAADEAQGVAVSARPRRTRRAPTPLYIPDPNTRFEDDFSDEGSEVGDAMEIVYEDPGSPGEASGDDDEDENEEEGEGEEPRTSAGYVKDGFVVSDDEAMSLVESGSDSEFEEEDDDEASSDEWPESGSSCGEESENM